MSKKDGATSFTRRELALSFGEMLDDCGIEVGIKRNEYESAQAKYAYADAMLAERAK